jgi:hypothetical protein
MNLPERRRFPRWRAEGAQVFLYIRGQRVQRCRARHISKAAVLVETDTKLTEGLTVELALSRHYAGHLVKMVRRSAYVARTSNSGTAVLLFLNRKA